MRITRNRSVILFSLIVGGLSLSLVGFIQSTLFAGWLKQVMIRYLPSDAGIQGDFSELAIQLFPPGLAIVNPELKLSEKNILDLPGGSEVRARRLELSFLPFQMLSGKIKIHRVRIVNGNVKAKIVQKKQKEHQAVSARLSWDDLLQVRIDSVIFDETVLEVTSERPALTAKLTADYASLDQVGNDKAVVYSVDVRLKDIEGEFPKAWSMPPSLERASAQASISSNGIRFKNLEIANDGLNFQAAGEIKGDVLEEGNALNSIGELSVEGDFDRVARWLGWKTENVRGKVQLQGQIEGDLSQPEKSLSAEGLLNIKNFAFGQWTFDECLAEAKWKASPDGGNLKVKKLTLLQAEAARVGGKSPGRGGSITVEPFDYTIGQSEPVTTKVDLKNAHIHWLAAPVIDDIFALDFRVTGTTRVQIAIPKNKNEKLGIKGDIDFSIPKFVLDNQRLQAVKPLSKVLDTTDLFLKGSVRLDGSVFSVTQAQLKVGKVSQFDVTGSVGPQGYDLRAQGPVDMADVHEIAQSPIRGTGTMDVSVHGPASNVLVDFDTDVKNAEYLGLELGDVKGRVIWDDDPSFVRFENVEVRKNVTEYSVFGKLDLMQDRADLDVKFNRGRIKDVSAIFHRLTDSFWWYPASLDGDITGNARVSGGISLDQLIVNAELLGSGWAFAGERFDQVLLEGGYDKGSYLLRKVSALKRSAQFDGHLHYSKDEEFDWSVRSQGLKLRDIDFFSRLDVPLRGDLQIVSSGKGTTDRLDSSTELLAKAVAVRGDVFSDSKLTMASQNGKWSVNGTLFGNQGSFDWKDGKSSGKLTNLDLSPILILINPKLLFDPMTSGRVSGSFDLTHLDGKIELDEAWVSKNGSKIALVKPVKIRMTDGSFASTTGQWVGESGEKAEISMEARKTKIFGTVLGDVPLSLVEFVTPTVQTFRGAAKLDLTIGGTFFQPEFKGSVRTTDGNLRISSVETPFENVSASVRVKNDLLTLEHASADLASGRVQASGVVELFKDRVPRLDLAANLNGPKLKVFPFQYAKVRGRTTVQGSELPYWIEGKIVLEGALSREKVLNHSQVQGLRTTDYMPVQGSDSSQSKFRLKIDVAAENGILVKNDLFDAELKANVTLVNTLDNPRLLGTADIVTGRMMFKDHIFQVQSGNVRFDNPAVMNPSYNLTATTDVSGRRVQLYSSGTMDRPKIELSANPAMSESEILSLLALGVSDDAKKIRSDRSTVEQGEAASLLLHSLDFNRDVQDRTGFEIQLDEAADAGTVTSAFKPRTAETDSTAAPKIVIKRKVGKRVELSVGSTVGVGTSSQREVNAEYRFTPAFSVMGVWDTLESVENQDRNTSYGLDFKLQKRFK